MITIRLATPADAEGILTIYAPYIENTSFTFETGVPSVKDFGERINSYLINWPWIVCEIDPRSTLLLLLGCKCRRAASPVAQAPGPHKSSFRFLKLPWRSQSSVQR